MRVAYVGLPLGAILLHGDGHEIVWAGVCRRAALGTRRLRRLVDRVEIVPDLEARAGEVDALDVDLVVSWFWTRRVPRSFREIARHGAIGVHPSLLPRWRGADPFYWCIAAGDAVTGVTAHVLEESYDTGALLGRESLAVDASWTAWELARALDRPSLRLLRRTVAAYAEGRPPKPERQDDADATDAPQPRDEELEVRWRSATDAIIRRIRAAAPHPGAFTSLGGETLVLTRVRATDDYPRALEPGEAVVRADGVTVVRTEDGAVELLSGRLEGDDEPLDALELSECMHAAGEL